MHVCLNTSCSTQEKDTASGIVSTDPDVAVQLDDYATADELHSGLPDVDKSSSVQIVVPQHNHAGDIGDGSSSGSEMFEDSLDPDELVVAQQLEAEEEQASSPTSASRPKQGNYLLRHRRQRQSQGEAEKFTPIDSVVEENNGTLHHHSEVMESLAQLHTAVTAISQRLQSIQASVSSLAMPLQTQGGKDRSERALDQWRSFPLISWVSGCSLCLSSCSF